MSADNNDINDAGIPDVMDEGDQAALFQMNENAKAIAETRARLAPEKHPDFDGETCIECGEDIPKQRLAMGRIRCVHCQEIIERNKRLYLGKGSAE